MTAAQKAAEALRQLREQDWSVAVHNDYRQGGERHTFWLMTHPSGRWIKGEGKTDDEAIAALTAEQAAVPPDREEMEFEYQKLSDLVRKQAPWIFDDIQVPPDREALAKRLVAFSNTLANEEADLVMAAVAALRSPAIESAPAA